MLACWRNCQLAREQAERRARGSAPRSRRRRSGSQAGRRGRQVSSEEDEETESEREADCERRPTKRRLMSQQLPLNLPDDAPDSDAPILSGSLTDVLECVRGECVVGGMGWAWRSKLILRLSLNDVPGSEV